MIGGLELADEGSVEIDGQALPQTEADLLAHRRSKGFLFQSYNLFPHLTVFENVALPLREVHDHSPDEAAARTEDVLAQFGMSEQALKQPGQLSGGQQQRVALARAIAHRPSMLLLDEPTSALDPELTADILDLVRELAEGGQKIILTTHAMGFARHVADWVAFLAAGKVVEEGPPQALFESPATPELTRFFEKLWRFRV